MKFIIPKTNDQLTSTGKLIVKTVAPQLAKQFAYNIFMPNENVIDSHRSQTPNSYLGTYTFSNLSLTDKSTGNTIVIDTALFNVTQTKNIITTSIQGRNGTVKEYISLGDYNVTIKGVLTGTNGLYPLDTLTQNTATVND
ncbi:MAG: DUF6046 domain-containing protein, partial [Bacteroidota bacterium]